MLGKIPANRLYPLGQNILNLWPMPNTSGLNYNYEVTPPIDKRTTQQPVVRVDYQVSAKLRLNAKYAGQRATVRPTAGSIPGFNDTLNQFPVRHHHLDDRQLCAEFDRDCRRHVGHGSESARLADHHRLDEPLQRRAL